MSQTNDKQNNTIDWFSGIVEAGLTGIGEVVGAAFRLLGDLLGGFSV